MSDLNRVEIVVNLVRKTNQLGVVPLEISLE